MPFRFAFLPPATPPTRLVIAPILLLVATASAAPRVAVLDRTETRAAGDLVTAACTRRGGVELVERARLADLLAERGLAPALTAEGSRELGRLLNAEGLLVIDQQGALQTARLVETRRGQIVDLIALDTGETPPGQAAEAIADRVSSAGAKLAIPEERRLYLAVMPFEGDSPERAVGDWLPSLNVLTGIHLLGRPEIFLVEREALAEVVSENDLAPDARRAVEAADALVRAQATRREDGRLLIRVRLTRNEKPPRDPTFFETNLVPERLAEGAAALADQLASRLAAVGPSATRSLAGEAKSFYILGSHHAARGRNREALRFLETSRALDAGEKTHTDILLKVYAATARQLELSTTNKTATLESRLDLLWRALGLADSTDHRCFVDGTPSAATLAAPLREVDPAGAPGEATRLAARIRALLREHLVRMVGLPLTVEHSLAPVAYADRPDLWKTGALARIASYGYNWAYARNILLEGALSTAQTVGWLEEIKREQPDRKAQAFVEMGRLELAKRSPEAMARMLNWVLGNPVERVTDLQFDGRYADSLLYFLILTRPGAEWPALFQKLILDPFEQEPNFYPCRDAASSWDSQRMAALKEGRAEEARAILDFQRSMLAALDRAVAQKRCQPHSKFTYDRAAAQLRKVVEAAGKGIPPPVERVARTPDSCLPLGDDGFPGARLLLDTKESNPSGIVDARTVFDGERLWCALRTRPSILLRIVGPDATPDRREDLALPVTGRDVRNDGPRVHLALWRNEMWVSDTRAVHRVSTQARPTLLASLPALDTWPGLPGAGAGGRVEITALVAGPDALYIGVSEFDATDPSASLLRAGSLYRWNPGMERPERITCSDALLPGPLNDCLPYAVRDGVTLPSTESVLLLLGGNEDPELIREENSDRPYLRVPTASPTFRPSDPGAGQRAGFWKYTPATREWARMDSRFPHDRLLRAYKTPGVASRIPPSRFSSPRDPLECNSVAVRACTADDLPSPRPQANPWPAIHGDIPDGSCYAVVRTGPTGEVVREEARVLVPGGHRWLDRGETPAGTLLALWRWGRVSIWLFPKTAGVSP